MADFRPIGSRAHPFLRRLRALGRRADARRTELVYLAEGVRWAEEALGAPDRVQAVLVSPRLSRSGRGERLRQRLREIPCERYEAPDALFDAAAQARTPQGVLLLVRRPDEELHTLLGRCAAGSEPGRIWVVAVGVQDPGNLGGLLRSSRALGGAGFVCWDGADLFHPRAVRASAGALLALPVACARDETELVGFLGALRARAALPRGGEEPGALDWSGSCALVLGGEAGGLPVPVLRACGARVSVPMRPGSESLNVGAAAAALLALIQAGRGGPDLGRTASAGERGS